MPSRALVIALASLVLLAVGTLRPEPACAQSAAERAESFSDRVRGANIPDAATSGAAAREGEGFVGRFGGSGPTPTPPGPTPTPTPVAPSCQNSFGGTCDTGLGANACCVPGFDGLPCITNGSSPEVPICTDLIGDPGCQPQVGAPCEVGGYEGCCDETLACENNRCQAP